MSRAQENNFVVLNIHKALLDTCLLNLTTLDFEFKRAYDNKS